MFLQNQPSEHEKMLEMIIDIVPFAVFYVQDRKIIFVNKAAEIVFGFSTAELKGKDMRLLYRSDVEYEVIGKQIYDKLETDQIHSEMYPYRRKDGKDIICAINAMRIGNSLTNNQIVVVFEDITDRITAEKELSESEEKYRNLLENSHDIILSLSPDRKFIHVNSIWFKTFGYAQPELQTLKIENIIHEKNLVAFNEQFEKALKNESTVILELNCTAKNGSLITLEGNLIPRSFYNKVIAVWGFYRDITEQKKTQEEIKNKILELERFNKIVVDRELKMIELKETIKKLQAQISMPNSNN